MMRPPPAGRLGRLRRAAAIAAIALAALAAWQLAALERGLPTRRLAVGDLPVTVLAPADRRPAPAVVIAHGFAGSAQLMLPFATTLARAGYVAVLFDFPGHGRHRSPLRGGIADDAAASRNLLAALDEVVALARTLPEADGRVALVGHSMASDTVVQYALDRPDVAATVAVSFFAREVTATRPRNLLVVTGALEPGLLRDEARRVTRMASDGEPLEGVTYGRFEDGTARRYALADGVEHIGVLYSPESLREALGWVGAAFGGAVHPGAGLDTRAGWLLLLYTALVLVVWPLSRLLPQVPATLPEVPRTWREFLWIALPPALLTPLVLAPLPLRFLPLLLGDYLVLHFGLYGVLTIALLRWRRGAGAFAGLWPPAARAAIAGGGFAAAYFVLAFALPTDAWVTSYLPTPERAALVPAMLCGTLPWFVADEWLTRGPGAPKGAYAVSKACFLASLALAIALNLRELFFLLIIVPAILLFFIVYGLFSRWLRDATGHPLPAAIGNAVALAWAVAVTFPIVAR